MIGLALVCAAILIGESVLIGVRLARAVTREGHEPRLGRLLLPPGTTVGRLGPLAPGCRLCGGDARPCTDGCMNLREMQEGYRRPSPTTMPGPPERRDGKVMPIRMPVPGPGARSSR